MLQIIPASAAQLAALAEGDDVYTSQFGHSVAKDYCEFAQAVEFSLERLWDGNAEPAWWTHLFVLAEANELIGMGGYTGAPSPEGTVEIGYSIAPAWRGRGFATAAVRNLVEHAFASPAVSRVIAHTLAQTNPSTRVLERCGFTHAGDIEDPDDGSLWRWELLRA